MDDNQFPRQISNESGLSSCWSDLETEFCEQRPLRVWSKSETPNKLKDHYKLADLIGKGKYSSVIVGQHLATKEKRAIKIVPLAKLQAERLVDVAEEISIASVVQHPNMVYLYETFKDEENLYLVMELCKGGDLYNHVMYWHLVGSYPAQRGVVTYTREGLPVEWLGKYLWQMVSGICYLHHHHIVHRDVKCENYLLKMRVKGSPLKLLDFGFSCKAEPGSILSKIIGTPLYMAPEVRTGTYNEKCDLYSLGVCCFFMCTCSYPYGSTRMTSEEIFESVARGKLIFRPKMWSDVPDELKTLIENWLSKDPLARASANQVMMLMDVFLRKHGWDVDRSMPLHEEKADQACCALS